MFRALRTARRVSAAFAMRSALGVASLALLGACGRQATVETALNAALNKDFALADQLQRRNAPTLVSTQELSPAVAAPAPAPVVHTRVVTRTVERAPAIGRRTQSAAVQATAANAERATDGEVVATTPATESDASTERATSSPVTSMPIGRQPQAQTVRDGAFGSIAGAIIGAAVSHGDRVRGGIIGAVTGGALGAIYGHSVDRTYAGVQSTYPTYRSYSGYPRSPRYRGTI